MYEQSYEFSFEAAHELSGTVAGEADHIYARLHGHSFVVMVTLRAEALVSDRWVVDFAELKAACTDVKAMLDHRLLNDVDGLDTPTLENIARWIFDDMRGRFPQTFKVDVARPTLREKVSYSAGA